MNIQIPETPLNGWQHAAAGPLSSTTIRPSNGPNYPMTPGMAIGLATPGVPPQSAGHGSQLTAMTPTTEEGALLEKTQTQQSQNKDGGDYFSNIPVSNGNGKAAPSTEASSDTGAENVPQTPSEETTTKKKALFSKKFNMSFNMKKFGGTTAAPEAAKPAAVDEKSEDSDSKSNKTDEKAFEDNFFGAVQKIRQAYEEQANMGMSTITSLIAPSLPNDTPVLKPPQSTTILIQEDRPDSGGVADLFEGKVGTLGQQADLIEKAAPTWLADVLLRVRICITIKPIITYHCRTKSP
jgi:WD repeat-containing protein 48